MKHAITSLFSKLGLLYVYMKERCRERSRDVAENVPGNRMGCCRMHLPIAWASSRDGQVKLSPTMITPPPPPPPLSSSLFVLFS